MDKGGKARQGKARAEREEAIAGRVDGRASAGKPPLFTPIIEFKTGPKPKTRPPSSQLTNPPARNHVCKRNGERLAWILPSSKMGKESRRPLTFFGYLARPQACISPDHPLPHLNDPVAAYTPCGSDRGRPLVQSGPRGSRSCPAPSVGRTDGRRDGPRRSGGEGGSAVAA